MEGYEVQWVLMNRRTIFYLCGTHYATRSVSPTAPEEIIRGPIEPPTDALCANCALSKEPRRTVA